MVSNTATTTVTIILTSKILDIIVIHIYPSKAFYLHVYVSTEEVNGRVPRKDYWNTYKMAAPIVGARIIPKPC